ncbi:apolipoprotein N-acyltransferase [Alteromonas sediminis]|uniref:Apolipoprotein N-acyltransferase n=1 Tax=Alteromonas sediminis TaxID=2259342 RepID=A0A3N5Y866_9ALTE|nr:apolipoprotein N-acyltransferase [Alteromonas sediminis]RPJ67159.1 apolipoprotein N-acyltransferase [Alteromonas sediminis]
MVTYLPYLLAALSGACLTLAYAPFDMWLITPVALVLFLRQWPKVPTKRVFVLGWCFGAGWFGAGISWVHVSIADFGGLPLIGSIALMALLCSYLALFPALALYLTTRFTAKHWWPVALACIWFFTEWLRSWVLTGFPWLSLGYSQLSSPLSGWMPVVGETGLTSLLVLLSACWALWSVKRQWQSLILITAVVVLGGYTLNQVPWVKASHTYTVSMVQGNIPQSLRWVPEQDEPTMQRYRALTDTLWDSDIVVWPEAAVPKLESLSQPYLIELDYTAAQTDTGLVTGIINYNFESGEVFNNVIALGQSGHNEENGHYRYFHANRYAKHHLLPIGEFVPFEDLLRNLAPIFDLPMSSFSRGNYQQANLLVNGASIAPALCFEIAFPRQLRANVTSTTDMILTVSNDAWFGRSHGPAQHMQIAQVRAKELGLPVIRATNNGITAFVDHNGNISSMLPQFETATLTDNVVTTRGQTPYRQLGDWPLVFIYLLTFIYTVKRGNMRTI